MKARIFKLKTVRTKPWCLRHPFGVYPAAFATFDEAIEALEYMLYIQACAEAAPKFAGFRLGPVA